MGTLGNNATMQHIEDALDLLCLLLPLNEVKQCRELVADLIQTLESTDKNLLESYTPQQLCSVLGYCETYCCGTSVVPQEIHISITSDPSIVNVMWVTQLLTPTPTVYYGSNPSSLSSSATGTSRVRINRYHSTNKRKTNVKTNNFCRLTHGADGTGIFT